MLGALLTAAIFVVLLLVWAYWPSREDESLERRDRWREGPAPGGVNAPWEGCAVLPASRPACPPRIPSVRGGSTPANEVRPRAWGSGRVTTA